MLTQSWPATYQYSGYSGYTYEIMNSNGEVEEFMKYDYEQNLPEPVIVFEEEEDYPDLGTGNIYHSMYMFPQNIETDKNFNRAEKMKNAIHIFKDKENNVVYPNEYNMREYESQGIVVTDIDGLNDVLNDHLSNTNLTKDDLIMNETQPDWLFFDIYDFIYEYMPSVSATIEVPDEILCYDIYEGEQLEPFLETTDEKFSFGAFDIKQNYEDLYLDLIIKNPKKSFEVGRSVFTLYSYNGTKIEAPKVSSDGLTISFHLGEIRDELQGVYFLKITNSYDFRAVDVVVRDNP